MHHEIDQRIEVGDGAPVVYLVALDAEFFGLIVDAFVTRHADLIGDIGRTQRQQQVLEALKKKLDLTSLITHLSELIADWQGQFYTDLSEQEIIAFAYYARSLPSSAIQHLSLGPGTGDQNFGEVAIVNDPTLGYQDVIIPNCATIQPVINKIFALGNAQSCNVTAPG